MRSDEDYSENVIYDIMSFEVTAKALSTITMGSAPAIMLIVAATWGRVANLRTFGDIHVVR